MPDEQHRRDQRHPTPGLVLLQPRHRGAAPLLQDPYNPRKSFHDILHNPSAMEPLNTTRHLMLDGTTPGVLAGYVCDWHGRALARTGVEGFPDTEKTNLRSIRLWWRLFRTGDHRCGYRTWQTLKPSANSAGAMKIRLTQFQKPRPSIPLRDNPYPSTKITFASFENRSSKCFMSFTTHST